MRCDALDGDPIEGDVFVVRDVAAAFGRIEQGAREAQQRLGSICEGVGDIVWSGPAADAFRARLQEVRPDLLKLEDSHRLAREAMAAYAGQLERAQLSGYQATAQAQDAVPERNRADLAADQARCDLRLAASAVRARDIELLTLHNAMRAADPTQYPELAGQERTAQARREAATRVMHEAKSRLGAAESARSVAESHLESARRLFDEARGLRDGAGAEVVRRLSEAGDAGIRNRSTVQRFWHDVQDLAVEAVNHPWFGPVTTSLGHMSTVLTALSLVTLVFCPLAAPVMIGLAIASAAVSGALLAGTLLQWSVGRATTRELIEKGVTTVLSAVGIKGAGALTKNHGLPGMVKRSLAPNDNRELSGLARRLLWTPLTVAPKSSVGEATFPFVTNPVRAFRFETALEAVHAGEMVHSLRQDGMELTRTLASDEECGR